MAIVGVLTAGIGSKLAMAAKVGALGRILKAGKGADEAAEISKALKIEKILEAIA